MARPRLRSLFGTAFLYRPGYQFGHASGYTHGLRDLGRLFIEMRQGALETPDHGTG
ncbi:hypothetical protein ACVWXO_008274 [Bradyrhizobium sp. LM2.7]